MEEISEIIMKLKKLQEDINGKNIGEIVDRYGESDAQRLRSLFELVSDIELEIEWQK